MQLLPNTTYHVYTHANGNENLFRTEENYHYFLKKYAEHVYPVAETYAYCLMPNHLHLAIKVRDEQTLIANLQEVKGKQAVDLTGFKNLSGLLSKQLGNLFNGYTKAYNERYDRMGSLFTRPFKRKMIEDDRYFQNLILYIHQNPVHHGFVKNLFDWPHSSIHAYLSNKPSKLNRHYLLEWIGNKERLFSLHRDIECMDLFEM